MSKVKGKRLSETERMEIIDQLEKPHPPSKRAISRQYNVNESSIRKLWANKDMVKMRGSGGEKHKVLMDRVSPQLETKLYNKLDTWMRASHKAGLPLSLHIIRTKASEIAKEIAWENFVPSMLREHRLRSLKDLKGVNFVTSSDEMLTALDVMQNEMKIFQPENVYSMVESCLFYSLAPHYARLFPQEDLTSHCGMKKANNRVSLAVCTNATGSHKLPCTVVCNPMTKNPSTSYMIEQKCAWIDSTAFWEWFNEYFYHQVRKRTTDSVLLLIEKSPAHFESFHRRNVTVRCIPPGCKEWRQHCQQLITALKKRYKHFYLVDVLRYNGLVECGLMEGSHCREPATLTNAAMNISSAWDDISEDVIKNCFHRESFSLQGDTEAGCEDIFEIEDLCLSFEQFSMPINERALIEFAHIDDFDSPYLCEVLVKEMDELLSGKDEMIESPHEASSSSFTFEGYKQLYARASNMEKQLSCAEAREKAPKIFEELKKSHLQFQRLLQKANLEEQIGKIMSQCHQQNTDDALGICSQNV